MDGDLLKEDRTDALGNCPVCGALYYAASRHEVLRCRSCRSLLRMDGELVEVLQRCSAQIRRRLVRRAGAILGICLAMGALALGLLANEYDWAKDAHHWVRTKSMELVHRVRRRFSKQKVDA